MVEGMLRSARQAPVRLVLVGYDPIFQAGLRSLLLQDKSIQILGTALSAPQLWQVMGASTLPDAIILDLDGPIATLNERMTLCRALKARYGQIPVLVVAGQVETGALEQLQQCGVEGYWPKGSEVEQLQRVLQVLLSGALAWPAILPTVPAVVQVQPVFGLGALTARLRYNSLKTISARRQLVAQGLQDNALSWWEWVVLTGQLRELNAAQQLLESILPISSSAPAVYTAVDESPDELLSGSLKGKKPSPVLSRLEPSGVGILATAAAFVTIKSLITERLAARLMQPLENYTETTLEIDILRPDKKQELCLTVLKRFEQLLDELRFSKVERPQLQQQRSQMLRDLWQGTVADFLGKYRVLTTSQSSGGGSIEVVNQVLLDAPLIQAVYLDPLPMVVELLEHPLFHMPLAMEQHTYPAGSSEAIFQGEALLNHLVLQIANAVVQPLINRFSTVEILRSDFFDARWRSTREIERFRNALSWKYRVQQWFDEPKDIFESQYRLLVISDLGIQYCPIYALRDRELKSLRGLPFFMTLALEFRDATTPPLRAVITFLGRGVVYLLTQIIGRSIGLVGRGILQGVGYVRSEVRSRAPQSTER
jgi:DNA-binding NarL/FixJ family response regulator